MNPAALARFNAGIARARAAYATDHPTDEDRQAAAEARHEARKAYQREAAREKRKKP